MVSLDMIKLHLARILGAAMVLLALIIAPSAASAHGGHSHVGESFGGKLELARAARIRGRQGDADGTQNQRVA